MNAARWHNALPEWVEADLGEHQLRQGPRATLQAMADRCDAPKGGDGEPLLVCLGGEGLIEQCRCSRSTFREHLRLLKGRGYVVELSHGGGRLASVYGIPGRRGQLDPHRASPDGKPRRWLKTDSEEVRRLVSEKRTLAADGTAAPQPPRSRPAEGSNANGCGPDSGGQGAENRTLPSHHTPSPLPTPEPAPSPADSDSSCIAYEDDAKKKLRERLRLLNYANPAERSRLVESDPAAVAKALDRLEEAIAEGKKTGRPVRRPGGLLRRLLEQKLGGPTGRTVANLAKELLPETDRSHAARVLRQASDYRRKGHL